MTVEPLHSPSEAAKILGISLKTLMEHVRLGRIRSILVGKGKTRKHRKFTDKNIETFIENQKVREVPACPSTKVLKVHTTPTTFKSTVVAFTALPKPETRKMPRQSNGN